MKKSVYFTAVLSIAAVCTSCSNDDENYPESQPLLNTVIENDGESQLFFSYGNGLSAFADNNSLYEFIYEPESFTDISRAIDEERGVEITYERPGKNLLSMVITDGLSETTRQYDLNNYRPDTGDEARVRILQNGEEEAIIFYHWPTDEHMTVQTIFKDGTRIFYDVRFDNKKNPFKNLWDFWRIDFSIDLTAYTDMPFFLEHNPVSITRDDGWFMQANYIYNEDGYPIQCNYRTAEGTGTINYFYN